MKLAILSLFLGVLTLCAQEKPPIQIPEGLRLSPTPMATPGIQQVLPRLRLDPDPGVVELQGTIPGVRQAPPSSLELTLKLNEGRSKVCSVPLLEAHAHANDPGIAVQPRTGSAPMPRAIAPAPACEK